MRRRSHPSTRTKVRAPNIYRKWIVSLPPVPAPDSHDYGTIAALISLERDYGTILAPALLNHDFNVIL